MAMTASQTVSSNIIAGRPAVAMLTLSNTGGSDVTVSSVQAVLTPSGPGRGGQPVVSVQPPQFPPNRSSTVTASGSLNVPVDFVINYPQTPGLPNVMAGSTYLLTFIIAVSDGTNFASDPKWISVGSGAPSPSQGYGQFRFDDGRNLINLAML